jgi:hypothetical protein
MNSIERRYQRLAAKVGKAKLRAQHEDDTWHHFAVHAKPVSTKLLTELAKLKYVNPAVVRHPPPQPPIKNHAERLVKTKLEREGYRVHRRGWPDFFCVRYNNGRIDAFAVEVKVNNITTSEWQQAMHSVLRAAGIPVHIYRLRNGELLLDEV